jgi:DNA-binding CsgD family transcriptional regulator
MGEYLGDGRRRQAYRPGSPTARAAGPTGRHRRSARPSGPLFEAALARWGPDDPFLDRALLHQAYGRMLHARGDRRPAVDHVRTARQQLASIGAQPFVSRVDADLAAALRGAEPSASRSTLDLTDRERDVALLVGRGMTNPEVAAQLYVSRKAVEYHLSNIYAKLGISSRRELRNAPLPD